ncbi:MAG TPA: P27 family phage terminase small subunit [Acidimicrobiales bacterium]|nr:P27 family phage terminase small subunit [Acidimicrobiales bacterium]
MGKRGPLPGSMRLVAQNRTSSGVPDTEVLPAEVNGRPIPPVPTSLGSAGRAMWQQTWTNATWLSPTLDLWAVSQLCEIVEERAVYQELLEESGPVVTEAIVTPVGHVVGERVLMHPAEQAIRRAERRIGELAAELGLSPKSRARFGLDLVELEQRKESLMAGRRKGTTA